MQYLHPMQVCLLTITMPSALLKDAPVGQTSQQGGCSQCWHIKGRAVTCPVRLSFIFTLLIQRGFCSAHNSSLAPSGFIKSFIPFSSSQASTQAIMELSVNSKKPIGNGIITCLNKKQAFERKKKGGEATNAVLSVLSQK